MRRASREKKSVHSFKPHNVYHRPYYKQAPSSVTRFLIYQCLYSTVKQRNKNIFHSELSHRFSASLNLRVKVDTATRGGAIGMNEIQVRKGHLLWKPCMWVAGGFWWESFTKNNFVWRVRKMLIFFLVDCTANFFT